MSYREIVAVLFFGLVTIPSVSQENIVAADNIAEDEKKLNLNVDIANRYLWRGQCWGGDYVVVQTTIQYAVTPKLTMGFWANTNFKSDYFYPDAVFWYYLMVAKKTKGLKKQNKNQVECQVAPRKL